MTLSKKLKFRIGILLLVIFSLGEVLGVTKVTATERKLENLGNISHYNAIIFGNHKAHTADIEGALAVKGNLIAPATPNSGFSIAAAATHANNLIGDHYIENEMPSFLLGGELSKVNGGGLLTIEADTVVHKEGADKQNLVSGNAYRTAVIKSESEILSKFNEFSKKVENLISHVKTLEGKENLYEDKDYLNVAKDKNDKNILISKLNGKTLNLSTIKAPKEIKDSKYWAIYSDAEEVNITAGAMFFDNNIIDTGKPNNNILKLLATKIIYVFPNAKNINISANGVVGSLIAPNAFTKVSGGSVNGQLITKDFDQAGGFECHNFYFNNWDTIPTNTLGNVSLEKFDSDNNFKLDGAEFELYRGTNPNGEYINKYITVDGKISVSNLPFGKYYFKEVKAPEGYEIGDNYIYPFEVNSTETIKITAKNKKIKHTGSVRLLKLDGNSKDKLENVVFNLFKEDKTTLIGTFTTNKNGEIFIEGLEEGIYYFKEKVPLDGYENTEEYYKVEINKNNSTEVKIEILNFKKKGGFKIEKIDSLTGNLLDGAIFELYKDDKETLIDTITVKDGTAEVKDLSLGTYYLKEVQAPEGYELNEEFIEIVVTENSLEALVKKITNTKKEVPPVEEIKLATLELVKYEKETEKVLEGAEFKLEGENYSSIKTTNSQGKILFENLPEGKYILTETKAPNGYIELNEEIEVIINTEDLNKIKFIRVDNEKLPVDPEDPKPPVDPEDPKPPVDPEDPKPPVDTEDPDNKLPSTGKDGLSVGYGILTMLIGLLLIKGRKA